MRLRCTAKQAFPPDAHHIGPVVQMATGAGYSLLRDADVSFAQVSKQARTPPRNPPTTQLAPPRRPPLSLAAKLVHGQLTCRGAWQCTQHPSVEALAITLTLLPGPGPIIPAEKVKARRRGGGPAAAEAVAGDTGVQRHGSGSEPCAGAADGGGGGAAVAGKEGRELWACARCTCLNAERRCVRLYYCSSSWAGAVGLSAGGDVN